MTKIKYFYFIGVLTLLFTACKSDGPRAKEQAAVKLDNAEILYGTWRLNKLDTLYGVSVDEQSKVRAGHAKNGLLMNFFPDNILTRIEGQKYTRTTWNFNGLKSSLSIGEVVEGLGDKFGFGFDKMEVSEKNGERFLKVENKQGVFHFRKTADMLNDVKDDPFHPDNNQWRVIAPKSETYRQMKERILNYTEHNYKLFKATKERGGDKVVNANSIGIYLYYDGAIGLVDGGKVPSAWMANFYSPDEAMDAYAFTKEYFKGGFIRKKHADGFVASGELILGQLVEKMEQQLAKTK